MRKSVVILVSAAVLICCLFAAGCVGSTDNPGEQPQGPAEPPVQTPLPDAVLSVAVEKTGSVYLPGDSVRLNLPYIAGTGYTWVVTEQAKGLDVQKLDAVYDHEEGFAGGTGVQPFVLSAKKEGTYPVTIKYMRPWEGEESALAEYSDELHVAAKSGEKPLDTPRGVFSYSSWKINPEAGEYVKITVAANPTTGYTWKMTDDGGLTVRENYVVDNPGLLGSPGTYEWYVTSDKAGTFFFSAECISPSGEKVASFEVPLIFAAPALPDAAVSVYIEKTGITYEPGECFEVDLPYIAGTGYTWVVTKQTEGLDIQKLDAVYDHEEGFAGGTGIQPFVLSAEKEGSYPYTIKYMRPWEGEESALAEYSDELHVAVVSGEKPLDTPRGVFTFDSGKVNPAAGEYAEVISPVHEGTDHIWKVTKSDGLSVTEKYVEAPLGLFGNQGYYVWYITADKAGAYTFEAQCTSPSGEVDAEFSLPLIFVKAEAAE